MHFVAVWSVLLVNALPRYFCFRTKVDLDYADSRLDEHSGSPEALARGGESCTQGWAFQGSDGSSPQKLIHGSAFGMLRLVYIAADTCAIVACSADDWTHRFLLFGGNGKNKYRKDAKKYLPPCKAKPQSAKSSGLVNIQDMNFKAFREFRSKQLSDQNVHDQDDVQILADYIGDLMQTELESVDPSNVTSNLMSQENEEMKKLMSWISLLDHDFSDIQDYFQQEKLKAVRKQKMEKVQQRRKLMRQLAQAKRAEPLIKLASEMHVELRDLGNSIKCEAPPESLGAELMASMYEAMGEHRKDQRDQMKEIAAQTIGITFSALSIAADAGMPGVGSALTVGGKVMAKSVQMAKSFAKKGGKAVSRVVNLAKGLESAAKSLEQQAVSLAGVDGRVADHLAHLQGSADAGLEEGRDQFRDEFKAQTEAERGLLTAAITASKTAAIEGAKAACKEGAWTAAELIPIVGPYVAMSKAVVDIMDTRKEAMQSRKDYFTFKDPIMRSVFHMRDCFLQVFLRSDAVSFARHEKEVSLNDRIAALVQVLDAVETAASLNDDLMRRLLKKAHLGQSKAHHEAAVMRRLQGEKDFWIRSKVPLQEDEGDTYLTQTVIKPSAWADRFSRVSQKINKIHALAATVSESEA